MPTSPGVKFDLPTRVYDWLRLPRTARWFRGLGIRRSSSILDVGSGSGGMLHGMASVGFLQLRGVDPFLQESMECADGVHLTKGEIYDVDGTFDVVMFHHSFEHMPEPRKVLEAAMELMSESGYGYWFGFRSPIRGLHSLS